MSDERRKFARIFLESNVKILFAQEDQRDQVLLENLSEGGLFLVTNSPKPIGTKLNFEFRVKNQEESIQGTGIVKWVEKDPSKRKGMGIQFMELNDAGKQIISKLFRKYKKLKKE
ncbi:MAG: PilZ domain-containing protein [Bdellovibrionales bacterium]|nr:PilZ domain-containing protein [Bdellovibrionales bacterium]